MKRFCLSCLARAFIIIIAIGIYGLWLRFNWQKNAVAAICPSNLKQIALGMSMYAADYDNKLPPAIFPGKTVGWANGLQPYMKSYVVFQCPLDTYPKQKIPRPNQPGFTDYWMNCNLSGVKGEKIDYVGNTIMLGDGDGGSLASTASYAINELPEIWRTSSDSPAKRHVGGANYAFVDAHVKWLKPEEVSQLLTSKKHPVYTFSVK